MTLNNAIATLTQRAWITLQTPLHTPAPQQYLFVLSHMRSYSSLLSHVLGSSSEIDGYGEMHIKYKRPMDLWHLRWEIQRSTGRHVSGRYLLDKILHNYIRAPDLLLPDANTRAIIFLRRPETTLRSIITLGRAQHQDEQFNNAQSACDYYVSRLHRLRTDGQRLGERALYFDAEQLLATPRRVLAGISRWLSLEQELSSQYTVAERTGETGFGDPLHNIRAGQILDTSHSTIDRSIEIPSTLLDEATAAYRRCREVLLSHCTHLQPTNISHT